MERRTIKQLEELAHVARAEPMPRWMVRRRRLERLASLLEAHRQPVRLFTEMECFHGSKRRALRQFCSPLTIAFYDPEFRREGLTGDSVGEGMDFFCLSAGEAHELLCDCHYSRTATSDAVAKRARALAGRLTFAELWDKTKALAARWRAAMG